MHPSQIKREVEAIIAKMSTQGANVLKYGAAMRADSPGWRHTAADAPGWRQVVSRGAWNELVLFGGGERIEANCVAAPATLRAIESVPDATALARCGCSRDDPDMFRSTAGQPPQTKLLLFYATGFIHTTRRERGGEIIISILEPGTHLRPHCGPCNNRLTVHLGLVVPPGCSIRVADETREWEVREPPSTHTPPSSCFAHW